MNLDFFVQLHLTERCNLRCRHCYQHGKGGEMTIDQVKGAIDNVASAVQGWVEDHHITVSPSLHLTGGEPLLRQDLFEVVSHARSSGFSVSLMSNGTLIDQPAATRIAESGVSDVQVSLEGQERTHDLIRGRGSYQKAVSGISNLVREGVEANINVTVSLLNCGQAAGMVGQAEQVKAGGIAFSRLVPSGRGAGLSSQVLDPNELALFYFELRRLKERSSIPVVSRDPLFTVMDMSGRAPDSDSPVAGCAAGFFGVTIGSDGAIMPCRRMDLPVGNINTDSFREVWADSEVLWKLRTRDQYEGSCRDCDYWSVCRGCRAVVLAMSRAEGMDNCLGPDLQCPLVSSKDNPGYRRPATRAA
ncbi:MAG: radical SAM protein [Chloroflexi bacterium]|nr:radical SAM protein [Chloroflexota bacterium]